MTSIGKIMTPVGGKCVGINWYKGAGACPEKLLITASYTSVGLYCVFISIDFASRGKIGYGCGGTDTYVTEPGDGTQIVDVWAAYRAAVWTSSTAIKVYLACKDAIINTGVVNAEPQTNAAARVTKTGTIMNGSPCVSPVCPTNLVATITVNDDGTFSIA